MLSQTERDKIATSNALLSVSLAAQYAAMTQYSGLQKTMAEQAYSVSDLAAWASEVCADNVRKFNAAGIERWVTDFGAVCRLVEHLQTLEQVGYVFNFETQKIERGNKWQL